MKCLINEQRKYYFSRHFLCEKGHTNIGWMCKALGFREIGLERLNPNVGGLLHIYIMYIVQGNDLYGRLYKSYTAIQIQCLTPSLNLNRIAKVEIASTYFK
jgi:hypothetical protein